MLVVSRKKDERLRIDLADGRYIWLVIADVRGKLVRVGIDAGLSVCSSAAVPSSRASSDRWRMATIEVTTTDCRMEALAGYLKLT